MYKKELLQELCSNLQARLALNPTNKTNKITLFSGVKPSMYYLPLMKIGTKPPINEHAWFVEISVDNMVVFRESMVPAQGVSIESLEERVIDKALKSVFMSGVMLAKNLIDKNNANR